MNQGSKPRDVDKINNKIESIKIAMHDLAIICGKYNEMRVVSDLDEAYAHLENAQYGLSTNKED